MTEARGDRSGHVERSSSNPVLSLDSLVLLRQILAAQTLQVGAPDFEEMARTAARALVELDAAISLAAEEQGQDEERSASLFARSRDQSA
jgi:hypothetical protein